MAQVVERWHSVWAKPRTGLGFFSVQNCCQTILTGCRAFLIMWNRLVHTLPSSFLSPFIIVKFFNCNLTTHQEKEKISPKGGRERPVFFLEFSTCEQEAAAESPDEPVCPTQYSLPGKEFPSQAYSATTSLPVTSSVAANGSRRLNLDMNNI